MRFVCSLLICLLATANATAQQLPPPPDPWVNAAPSTSATQAVSPAGTYDAPSSFGSLPAGSPADGQAMHLERVPHQISPPWYTWDHWFEPEIWSASLELGLNLTSGNSDTLSFQSGAELTRETELNKLNFDFTYAKNQANGVETQHYAVADARHDYLFGDSPWSWFNKAALRYDEFRAFDVRLVLNTGLGYALWDTAASKLNTRFGAGVSREFGGPDDHWIPEAVFGLDYEKQLTKMQKLKATVDYFPSWDNWATDYRVTTDVSWQIVLDEAANLSLKLGVIDQYDSTPNGAKPNDFAYSFLLLWKK